MTAPEKAQTGVLARIALAQLLALSLWFSASAVAPQLRELWRLTPGEEAGLTLAVQIGFVVGAVVSALLNVADVIPSRRLFLISALGGAAANLGLLAMTDETVPVMLALRFSTGVFLAGVYPAGLKVMAGWFKERRGMALGVLVGALSVGSAAPHLVRGLGLEFRGVVLAASVLTVVASLLMQTVGDGPYEVPSQPFRIRQVADVVANRGFRLATFGYLGHMWELYAMWTWMAAFLTASVAASGTSYGSIPILTFAVIAMGGPGSWLAGMMADRYGRTTVAGGAMLISGACSLGTIVVFGGPALAVVPLVLVWGATVVADSAQFSAMVTETSEPETRGTALTLQTALGFLLTLVTIRGVPVVADAVGWRYSFALLALGPALGVVAMRLLRASSYRVRLAGGRG